MSNRLALCVMVIIISCARQGTEPSSSESPGPSVPTPILNGQAIGNGGDPIRLLFEEGRQYALGMLERIDIQSASLKQDDLSWLQNNKENIIRNIKTTRYIWAENVPEGICSANTCACTQTGSQITYLSYAKCRQATKSKRDAAKTILVEEHHRLVPTIKGKEMEEQATADRIANSIYTAWLQMGHVENPHWLSLQTPFPLFNTNIPVWTDEGMLLIQPWGIRRYDHKLNQWSSWNPDGPGARRDKNRFPWMIRGHAEALGSKIIVFSNCDSLKEQGAAVTYNSVEDNWHPINDPMIPEKRDRAFYFNVDGRIVVWGGSHCLTGLPLHDGSVYDSKTDIWVHIPPTSLPAPTSVNPVKVAAVVADNRLVAWGGKPSEQIGAQLDLSSMQWTEIPSCREFPPGSLTFGFSLNGSAFFYDVGFAKGASFSSRENQWQPMAGNGLYKGPSNPRQLGEFHVASNGTTAIVVAEGKFFVYDVNEGWIGPFLVPSWKENPFFNKKDEFFAKWTGMEWIVWNNHQAFRLYP